MDVFAALSELSNIGKKSKEVPVGQLKLLLSTLDSEQESLVFIACSDMTGNAYFSRLKSETLKYAIIAVNGERLDSYVNALPEKKESLKKETLEKLENIIKTWDENVISFLYAKWIELTKESEEDLKKLGLIEEDKETEKK